MLQKRILKSYCLQREGDSIAGAVALQESMSGLKVQVQFSCRDIGHYTENVAWPNMPAFWSDRFLLVSSLEGGVRGGGNDIEFNRVMRDHGGRYG